METRLEGIVRADRYDPGGQGKQFLGAAIECSDGTVWVIDYEEESPYHAFAGHWVVVSGEPYEPDGQHLIGWRGAKRLRHFRVSTMRLVEATPDAWLIEVGAGHHLSGRLERGTGGAGVSALSFVAENGDTFLVVNHPAGATVGRDVKGLAYSVRPTLPRSSGQYHWVLGPRSSADVWEWRGRPHAGLPCDVYVDAESGQFRRRQASAEQDAAADRRSE